MVLKHDQIASQCSLPSSPLSPRSSLETNSRKKYNPYADDERKPYNDAGNNKRHAVHGVSEPSQKQCLKEEI